MPIRLTGRWSSTWLAIVVAPLIAAGDGPPLAMSPGKVCSNVRGYGDFDERPEPSLTRDEKLQIYCEPTGFATGTRPDGSTYVHLVVDAKIRRKGRKEVLWSKDAIVDYESEGSSPPAVVYLASTFAVRGLKPGDYQADLVLRDKHDPAARAEQTVDFRIVLPSTAGGSSAPNRGR